MSKRKNRSLIKRIGIDIAGFGLVLLGILTSPIPGPGGIPIALAGLGILSLNYEWADKLLKNFDNKRIEYTDRYLNNPDPLTSRMIDVSALAMSGGGLWLVLTADNLTFRAIGIGLSVLGILLVFSNQKRIDRIIKNLKKSKQK